MRVTNFISLLVFGCSGPIGDLSFLFCHSYDVMMITGKDEILSQFKDFHASLVFSAESFCAPDGSLVVSKGNVLSKQLISLSVCPSICPSVRPSVCLSVCLSVRPSVGRSICLCTLKMNGTDRKQFKKPNRDSTD